MLDIFLTVTLLSIHPVAILLDLHCARFELCLSWSRGGRNSAFGSQCHGGEREGIGNAACATWVEAWQSFWAVDSTGGGVESCHVLEILRECFWLCQFKAIPPQLYYYNILPPSQVSFWLLAVYRSTPFRMIWHHRNDWERKLHPGISKIHTISDCRGSQKRSRQNQQLLRNVLIGVLSVFAVMNTMSGTFVQELLCRSHEHVYRMKVDSWTRVDDSNSAR